MFGRPSYQIHYDCSFHQPVNVYVIPEPTSIVFLGLGALGVWCLRNKGMIGKTACASTEDLDCGYF